ncbi:hypothetical protein BD770DRAFT_64981 [Pilaira anomala]|nr:hypothetical protein BD770DRAFT_64981 [Pilaira anomala]
MFSWFGFDTKKEQQQQQQRPITYIQKNGQGEKSMITSKVSPTVKSTSVNVIVEEVVNNFNLDRSDSSIYSEPESFVLNEPLRSASISLTIELAKKTSMSSLKSNSTKPKPIPFVQKPDTITPHSSLPKSMVIQKKQRAPSSIASNSSNSLLHRMAHSPKASAATFPTSVSASGNAYYVKQEEEHETIRSAAIESLTKRMPCYSPTAISDVEDDDDDDEEINDAPATTTTSFDNEYFDNQKNQLQTLINQQPQQQIKDDTEPEETITSPTLSTCENKSSAIQQDNKGGFWSWMGFSSYSETDNNDSLNTDSNTEHKLQIITKQEEIAVTTETTITTTTEATIIATANTQQQPEAVLASSEAIKQEKSSWSSYFYSSKQSTVQNDVKKDTIIPSPVSAPEQKTPAKLKITSSLPTSDGIKSPTPNQTLRLSASNPSFHLRKKNEVLPPFESQFTLAEIPEIVTPINNNNTNIITRAIEAINSILIQPLPDQPEDTSSWIAKRMRAKFSNFVEDMKSLDPKTIVDKRIVVVGVHGWFPMKYDWGTYWYIIEIL